jgi:hypothetical protein
LFLNPFPLRFDQNHHQIGISYFLKTFFENLKEKTWRIQMRHKNN